MKYDSEPEKKNEKYNELTSTSSDIVSKYDITKEDLII